MSLARDKANNNIHTGERTRRAFIYPTQRYVILLGYRRNMNVCDEFIYQKTLMGVVFKKARQEKEVPRTEAA